MTSSGSSETSSQRSDDGEHSIKDLRDEKTHKELQYPLLTIYSDIPNESSSDRSPTPPSHSNLNFTSNHNSPYKQSLNLLETTPKRNNEDMTPTIKLEDEDTKLNKELLQRQIYAHRAKLRKQPLLKLLESLNVDTTLYNQNDKVGKSNRSNPSPRGRKGALQSEIKSIHSNSSPISIGITSSSPTERNSLNTHSNNISSSSLEGDSNPENNYHNDSINTQKEDTLLWCHQQINSVRALGNVGNTVYFHQVLLADSTSPYSSQGPNDYRNVDRVEPSTDLDEILCLLRCAGKIFITEVMALAQSVEQSEFLRRRGNSFPDATSLSDLPYQRFNSTFDNEKSHYFSSKSSDTRILLPKHIYEAVKKIKGLE